MPEKIKDEIKKIAYETFQITCYMFPLEDWEAGEMTCSEIPDYQTGAVVAFDGAANGMLVIKPCRQMYEAIAANMLGVDEATDSEKEAALCEIANIVCGNTVPLFANNSKICLIKPPEIMKENHPLEKKTVGMYKEVIEIFFDEGAAEISIFYENGGS